MGIFSQLLARREERALSWDPKIRDSSHVALSGVSVTPKSSLQSMAVLACVMILADTVASLPLLTYRRRNGEKERATGHPLYKLLHDQPNPLQTPFEFRQRQMIDIATHGAGPSLIEWSATGWPTAIWRMNPDNIGLEMTEDRQLIITYYSSTSGRGWILPPWDVHMPVWATDSTGVRWLSPVGVAKNAIGLGVAAEEFGSKFYANGVRPSVILRHPRQLKPEAYRNIRASFEDAYSGLANAHRVAILEEGMEVETVGIPPDQAQFLETRKYQVEEIARLYRVPASLVGINDGVNYASEEQKGIQFITHTIRPWAVRIEQRLMADLLTPAERADYHIEFLLDGLQRADIKSRYEAYATGINAGFLNVDDARTLENLPTVEGGDLHLRPLNMVTFGGRGGGGRAARAVVVDQDDHAITCTCGRCGSDAQPEQRQATRLLETRSDDSVADRRRRAMRQYQRLLEDNATRIVRREVADIRRALAKQGMRSRRATPADTELFRSWLAQFYEELRGVIPDILLATGETMAATMAELVASELDKEDAGLTDSLRQFVGEMLAAAAGAYVASGQRQLEALMDEAEETGTDAGAAIDERLTGWEETKPGKSAEQWAFELGNALIISSYRDSGVVYLRWHASGKSCAYCSRLHGQIAGIDSYFVNAGDELGGGDGDQPLRVRRNARHGPIHRKCDCVVLAG